MIKNITSHTVTSIKVFGQNQINQNTFDFKIPLRCNYKKNTKIKSNFFAMKFAYFSLCLVEFPPRSLVSPINQKICTSVYSSSQLSLIIILTPQDNDPNGLSHQNQGHSLNAQDKCNKTFSVQWQTKLFMNQKLDFFKHVGKAKGRDWIYFT